MKAFWVQMISLDLFFRNLRGHCHDNQFYEKNGKLLSFIALVYRNGMGYHYLNVHINSANDAFISCEKFVKFGPVTPELTQVVCERQVQQGQKIGCLVEYLRIYWTDFHKALYVTMVTK